MEEIDIIIYMKKKQAKRILNMKLIKAQSRNLIKKCMTISITNFSFC